MDDPRSYTADELSTMAHAVAAQLQAWCGALTDEEHQVDWATSWDSSTLAAFITVLDAALTLAYYAQDMHQEAA